MPRRAPVPAVSRSTTTGTGKNGRRQAAKVVDAEQAAYTRQARGPQLPHMAEFPFTFATTTDPLTGPDPRDRCPPARPPAPAPASSKWAPTPSTTGPMPPSSPPTRGAGRRSCRRTCATACSRPRTLRAPPACRDSANPVRPSPYYRAAFYAMVRRGAGWRRADGDARAVGPSRTLPTTTRSTRSAFATSPSGRPKGATSGTRCSCRPSTPTAISWRGPRSPGRGARSPRWQAGGRDAIPRGRPARGDRLHEFRSRPRQTSGRPSTATSPFSLEERYPGGEPQYLLRRGGGRAGPRAVPAARRAARCPLLAPCPIHVTISILSNRWLSDLPGPRSKNPTRALPGRTPARPSIARTAPWPQDGPQHLGPPTGPERPPARQAARLAAPQTPATGRPPQSWSTA